MRCQDEIRAAEPPPPAIKERDNEGPQSDEYDNPEEEE